jgi:DNA-binding NtrC family response regulator
MEVHDELLPGSRVLVIDDDENMARSIERRLNRHKVEVALVHSGNDALEALGREAIDVILLDVRMPDMDGIEVLTAIKESWPDIPVIMMTGYATVEMAVNAMKIGAFDFIQKPFEPEELVLIMISKGLQQRQLLQRYASLQKEVEDRYRFENLVGKSKAMQEVFRTIERISHSESTVLITGESGTGKELIARAIHYNSPRRKTPFVAVDLGALTENVIESELFGHVKGSFTGAVTDHKGLFRIADGGTILLDEVGEIPLKVQARLLRVIQEREVKPVGGSHPIRVNVRVLAATNKNLTELVQNGAFREDLYYRLRVVPLAVPPLRERREDIPLLIKHFIEKHASPGAGTRPNFSPDAIEMLSSYDWPGNVRELENMIERLLALCGGNLTVIKAEDLPAEVWVVSTEGKPQISFENYERMAIEKALNENAGDIGKVAAILGVGKSTLYRKMKAHNLKTPRKQK